MANVYEAEAERGIPGDQTGSWTERELVFADIEGQGELSRIRNEPVVDQDGKVQTGLRPKITHHGDLFGRRVYGSVDKVHWGTHDGVDACLFVVRFRFFARSGLFRLRKAGITLSFDNYSLSNTPSSPRKEPKVVMYSPKHIFGIPTEVEREYKWGIAFQCSASVGPVSIGPEVSLDRGRKFKVEESLEIAGTSEPDFDKMEPNKAIFEVDENPSCDRGVPRELFFGVVVEHDGPIQADVSTSIDDRWAWPWTKDDPIILHPGDTYGRVPISIPMTFEGLTDDDWKILVPYEGERANVVQGQ